MEASSIILALPLLFHVAVAVAGPCRIFYGSIPINYPFGVDDGCGATQFRHMFSCNATELFFLTQSGSYKVQSIDYQKQSMTVYDPAMSTCSILQPHHDFVMTEIQSTVIRPTSDTVFALLNCSVDSPVLNRYRNLCFNFAGHSCDELYGACNAFRVFHLLTNSSSSCCFTGYDTVRYMSMNILDCSHYTNVINADELKGVGPLDWVYGIKLSFAVPESGCDRCTRSGGACGFDTESEGMVCLYSSSTNSTRECARGSLVNEGSRRNQWNLCLCQMMVVLILMLCCTANSFGGKTNIFPKFYDFVQNNLQTFKFNDLPNASYGKRWTR